MFDKLVQKTQQLKENIKEQIAVGVHEKLEGVPFANRLFPGAGLAVRAYMREGDAAMKRAIDGGSMERGFGDIQHAKEMYDHALNLAGRAYGVSKYLDHDAKGSRVACVEGIPSAKLVRTKFGNPIRAASRKPFLEELAFRGDNADRFLNAIRHTLMGDVVFKPAHDHVNQNLLQCAKSIMSDYRYAADAYSANQIFSKHRALRYVDDGYKPKGVLPVFKEQPAFQRNAMSASDFIKGLSGQRSGWSEVDSDNNNTACKAIRL